MARPSYVLPKLFALVLCFSAVLFSAAPAEAAELLAVRGPGGYLSLLKIGLVAVVFLTWVYLSDWLNSDTVRVGDLTGHTAEIWNPINLVLHLMGFFAAISIPIFWVGFPIYVACAFLPYMIYRFIRRSKMKNDSSIKQRLNPEQGLQLAALEQDQGASLDFSPAGSTDEARQANLIHARQSAGFVVMKDMIVEILLKRADTVLIDYSQTQATPRILVDGTWHPLPAMDRPTGDAVLTSIKHLAGLNPADRRNKQSGRFALKSPEFGKRKVDVITQGIPNGERAQLKMIGDASSKLPLKKLGMLPSMDKIFSEALNKPGICIVSAPKAEGLTTSWQGLLLSADRLTRDCVGMVSDENEEESAVENIVLRNYKPSQQKEQVVQALLTRPDSVAVSDVESPEVTDVLTAGVAEQDISVWMRSSAKSTVEALLRLMKNSKNPNQFAETVRYVTNQRLARRLCDHCKQEIRVQPKLIKQLGGDPRKQSTIFQAFRLPPPEQRVDEQGNPIEFPPCQTCGGLGHVGRIALYEMLTINDEVREVLMQTPKPAAIDAVAKRSNAKMAMASSAYRLVLLGVISLQEAQASLKK